MCKKGNGSIYAECRDAMRIMTDTARLPNQEMRRMLAEHGGCFRPQRVPPHPLDKRDTIPIG